MKKFLIFAVFGIVLSLIIITGSLLFAKNDSTNPIKDVFSEIENKPDLPDISTFGTNPSDTFIIAEADYGNIDGGHPYLGTLTSCPHAGAHIHFTDNNAPYETEILAPADGYIDRIDLCHDLGIHDKFDVTLAFAEYEDKTVSLDMSIEPFSGHRCKDNPDYYSQYILVEKNQEVKKGDVIAVMPKYGELENEGTHIHFNLIVDGSDFACPNIFNQDITNSFKDMIGDFRYCNGLETEVATFCHQPGNGEDLLD